MNIEAEIKAMMPREWLTILDVKSGDVRTIGADDARQMIGSGRAVETIPNDPEKAKEWLSALRAHVHESVGRMRRDDLWPAFLEYEAWCEDEGLIALPASLEDVVRYLLTIGAANASQNDVRSKAALIGLVHGIARHPPRDLGKHAANAYARAIGFAKMRMQEQRGTPLSQRLADVPRMALTMFPDGIVPMRWADVGK